MSSSQEEFLEVEGPSDPVWITDPTDWRLSAPPRGNPGEAIYTGGWRCAGAMGFYRDCGATADHVVTIPFYVLDPSGDTRHCCYCAPCAKRFLGVVQP